MSINKTNLRADIRRKLNTTEQESVRLQIPERTMVKARSTGHPAIPFIRIGKTIRYDPDAVDAWLDKNSFNKVEG